MRNSLRSLILIVVAVVAACRPFDSQAETSVQRSDSLQPPSAHLPFGVPSPLGGENDYLVSHSSFTLSYNNSRGTLNWIAWKTTAGDLGERRERPLFEPDTALPSGFRRIHYYDYSGSGYDRGHMVPAADRFANERLMNETFLMTNIVPQTADLNQYPWNDLEQHARSLARRGYDIYQVAGVYGENGRLRGKVVVPSNCWKVIAVLGRNELSITEETPIIAVDMPNSDGIANRKWGQYRTTVRSIERRTGFDLFASLPRDLQDIIENR